MAESTTSTPSDPKIGLFAGTPHEIDDRIGEGDVAINLFGFDESDRSSGRDEEGTTYSYLQQYLWSSATVGSNFEYDGQVMVALPGGGGVTTYRRDKYRNADWDRKSCLLRRPMGGVGEEEEEGGRRRRRPGRGSSSSYYNLTLRALERVEGGEELFVDFGENFYDDLEDPKKKKDDDDDDSALREEHCEEADRLASKFRAFLDKHDEAMDEERKGKVYDYLLNAVLKTGGKDERVTSLLPSTHQELEGFEATGCPSGADENDIKHFRRSTEWLSERGMCADNLRPGPSTISSAGLGAFAVRPMKRGERIAPAPLIQILDRSVMDMTSYDDDDKRKGNEKNRKKRKQLWLNYCFGHPRSSVLLYPFGPATNLINHQSGDKTNAKIVWSSHPFHDESWLDLTPEELEGEDYQRVNVMFDVVATRDVDVGEEVFLDYGPEWSKAWDEHVRGTQNKSTKPRRTTIRALDVNESYRTRPYKILRERVREPYPDGIFTGCFVKAKSELHYDDDEREISYRWLRGDDSDDDGELYHGHHLYRCDVVNRIVATSLSGDGIGIGGGDDDDDDASGRYWYEVRVHGLVDDDGADGRDVYATTVRDVPHDAIVFLDETGRSDQHDEDAFRHHIGVPDEIFPTAWKNL